MIHPSLLGTVPVHACCLVTMEFPFVFKIVPVCQVNNLAALVIIKILWICKRLLECSLYLLALKSGSFLRTLLYFRPSSMMAVCLPTLLILLCPEGDYMSSLSSLLLVLTFKLFSKSFLSNVITLVLSHHLSPF